jgi:co-chaperonin GroES (HSP10)
MYRVVPLFDRVSVERCISTEYTEEKDPETGDLIYKTKEGLIVHPDQIEQHPEFRVIAVGPDCGKNPLTGAKNKTKVVEPGDIVLLGQMSGVEYRDQMIVFEDEILARLDEIEPTETE